MTPPSLLLYPGHPCGFGYRQCAAIRKSQPERFIPPINSSLNRYLKIIPTRVSPVIRKAQDLEPLTLEENRMLEQAYTVIWNRTQTQLNYVMTELDFKVFNYFQRRWMGNNLAQQAVARHWAARSNADGLA